MTVVLDTCVAFEIAFRGQNFQKYSEILEKAERVIAPTLYDAEVTNVLWKYAKAGYIDEQNAQLTMALLLKLIDSYSDTSELAVEALHESIRLNHPVYDLYYMILARRNGAILLTVDEKLKKVCKECGIQVI